MLNDHTWEKLYHLHMRNHLICAALLVAAIAVKASGSEHEALRSATLDDLPTAVSQARGWTLGEDAATKQNPLKPDETTLAAGKAIFKQKCQKCHGPGGLGDGPDADPDASEDMDLTNPKRAERNSDGVVYYKVHNGRSRPKMPAFKDELTEEQIWSVVTYVQTLRKKS
jgi:mono/diheme cytochrome c family protein